MFRAGSLVASGCSYEGPWCFFRFRKPRAGKLSGNDPLDVTPIAFVHMPKTSAQALTKGLIKALKPAVIVRGFDRSMFGAFIGFETLGNEVRSNIHLDWAKMPPDAELIAGHFA